MIMLSYMHLHIEETKKQNYEGGEAFEPATPEMGLYKVVINNLLENK